MIGTVLSLILAILLYLSPYDIGDTPAVVKTIMIATAVIYLFIIPIGTMFSWTPMQKAEQNLTPRIMEMFRKDKRVTFAAIWLVAFSLLTFLLVMDPLYTFAMKKDWLFPLWLVLFGISFDAVRQFLRSVSSYLNPFAVLKLFSQKATTAIEQDRELDLCDWIDALSEVAIKGIDRHSTSIGHMALQEEQKLARQFLLASKSIGHETQDKQMKSAGITDKVSYTMFYLYQRLDIVFEKALRNRLEPTCTLVVTQFGKIAVDAAKYDMSLASAPLRFLGKCAKRAQDEGFEETALTASCVLFAVAKEILAEVDITYYEIKDTFLSIINGMETLAKGTFRRDKTTNITLLMQPFKELRALFESGKAKDHQDTPVILQNIDRVLGEFEALAQVMNTMPTIPKIEELGEEPPKQVLQP